MSNIIRLQGETPVAKGGRRLVYRHPGNPRWIIKVWRPDYEARHWSNPSWRQKRKRYQQFGPFFHEVREHLAICAKQGRVPRHMQSMVGFADTDLGLGLVYEAVFAPDGVGYAPDLKSIVLDGGYTPDIDAALQTFRAWLIDAPIVVGDLRPANLVLARDETGAPYFVLIDGIGEKMAIPIHGAWPWLNRIHTRGRLKALDIHLQRLLERAKVA
jgi:hypothetical protein